MAEDSRAPAQGTEKKNPIKEITDKLEQGLKELFESERYKSYLTTMSKFHNYSFNNTLLIASQKPDATLVAGFDSWKKNFDRHVKRGEKGIKIIAPMAYKKKVEQPVVDPVTKKPVVDENGRAKTEEVEIKVPSFQVVTVFDVSSTEGKEIPNLGVSELTAGVEGYKDMIAALERFSRVPIEREDIASGAKGYFDPTNQKIVLQKGMSEAQTVKTLIHEISHSLTDDKENPGIDVENPTERTRSTKEVTAESVAYTVCQRFGIDTSDYSFGYIAGWSSGKDMKELKDSMDLIRRTASEVINGVEDNLKMLAIERFAHEAMNVEKEPAEPAGRTFEIWQLKDTPENHKIMFENMEYMYQNDIPVDRENYEKKYEGSLAENTDLEDIYERFNVDRPEDFKGHSLSVSDIVVVKDEAGEKAFYVDSFGFEEIPEFLAVKEMEQDISEKEEKAFSAEKGTTETEKSAARELAERLDQFAYDYNPYEYNDVIGGTGDREANISMLAADLEAGNMESFVEFFQNIIEDDNSLEADVEEAKDLLSAVDAFKPDVKVEEQAVVSQAPMAPAPDIATNTPGNGKQKAEPAKTPAKASKAADKGQSKASSQTKASDKKTSLKARLDDKKEKVSKPEKKEKTKSKKAEREGL